MGLLGACLSDNHGLDCDALRRGRETGATAMLDASSSARDKAIARRVATRRAVAARAWALSRPRSRCASIASLDAPSPSPCSGGPGHGHYSDRLLRVSLHPGELKRRLAATGRDRGDHDL